MPYPAGMEGRFSFLTLVFSLKPSVKRDKFIFSDLSFFFFFFFVFSSWLSASVFFNSTMPASMLSHFSHAQLFETPWTVAHQNPLSMEFWHGLPSPPPGDLPDPGIEPESLMSPALADRFFTPSTTWVALNSTSVLHLIQFKEYLLSTYWVPSIVLGIWRREYTFKNKQSIFIINSIALE